MTSKISKTFMSAGTMLIASAIASHAASISNSDAEAHTLVITEDGVKNEVVIGAGEAITACASGCFITMPNGDRAVLSGGESVEIIGGAAVIN